MACNGREYYEHGRIEAIVIMETIFEILVDLGAESLDAMSVSMGIKYIERAGLKDLEKATEDLLKASTFFYRALYGEWPDYEEMSRVERKFLGARSDGFGSKAKDGISTGLESAAVDG